MKKFFSIPEAAKICSVNSSTMHRWAIAGKIKSHSTPGGHKRILKEDLKAWLEEKDMPIDFDAVENKTIKILIVDDEVSIQNYLIRLLSGLLVEIEVASNGFEAGKKVVNFKPDLMILDLFMPEMNGFEVCHDVKSDPLTKNIKIIILTGRSTKEICDQSFALGADAFIEKPSTRKEIITVVKSLLKLK
jgi:excisionase family DNA binding protein